MYAIFVRRTNGFTIVELLIVVVVIAILAAITVMAYNGITNRATETTMKSDLHTAATTLGTDNVANGSYPSSSSAANNGQGLKSSGSNTLNYSVTPSGYCASVSNPKTSSIFSITEGGTIINGGCPTPAIQTVTTANCPTAAQIRVVDVRDTHTYWVQKFSDGKCWMLTNLAYAGGGTNTYNDVKSLTNGTAGAATYLAPNYYVVPSTTNFTTDPTDPSTSTSGIGQYGYLYNWCAALGGQTTAACTNATTPAIDPSTSICPAGWRLPVGNGGDFTGLITATNGGPGADTGMRTNWLSQRSGVWSSGFAAQDTAGYYWSSTQSSAGVAFNMGVFSSSILSNGNANKNVGNAVRCVAN